MSHRGDDGEPVRTGRGRHLLALAVILMLVAGALAACGGDDSADPTTTTAAAPPASEPEVPGVDYASGAGAPPLSTEGAPRQLSGAGIGPLGGDLQEQATEAGRAAGEDAGPQVTLRKLKIGYLDIVGGIESADRAHNSLRSAFGRLGADWVYCDGAGDPAKWSRCGQSLIAQGVDVIALTGIDPSSIPSVVRQARARDIPIVDCCGTVGPGYAVQMAPDESRKGEILARYLDAKLGDEGGDIMLIDYPAPWAQERSAQLRDVVAGDDALRIAVRLTTNPSDLVGGTQKDVADALTANPDLRAVWIDFDVAGAVAGKAVQMANQGESFPEKPLVATFHADPSTQSLMRDGAIDVVVDNNYDATAWQVADAVAEHFARGTPFPEYGVSFEYPGIGDPLSYQIVTRDNLPEETGQYVAPPVDVVSYFTAKWQAEGFGS